LAFEALKTTELLFLSGKSYKLRRINMRCSKQKRASINDIKADITKVFQGKDIGTTVTKLEIL